MTDKILKGLGIDPKDFESLGENPTEEQITAFTGNVVNSWKEAGKNDPEYKKKLNAEAFGSIMGTLRSTLKKTGIEGEVQSIADVGAVVNNHVLAKSGQGNAELTNSFNELQGKFAEINEKHTQANAKIQELESSIPSLKEQAYNQVESKYHVLSRLNHLSQEKKIQKANFGRLYGSFESQMEGIKVVKGQDGFDVKNADGSDLYEANKKQGIDDVLLRISENFGLRIMSDPKGQEPKREAKGSESNFRGVNKIMDKA